MALMSPNISASVPKSCWTPGVGGTANFSANLLRSGGIVGLAPVLQRINIGILMWQSLWQSQWESLPVGNG